MRNYPRLLSFACATWLSCLFAVEAKEAKPASATERLPALDRQGLSDDDKAFNTMLAKQGERLPFRIADEEGNLIGVYRVHGYSPPLGKAAMDVGYALGKSAILTRRMQEIAVLTTARASRTAFVWYAHEGLSRNMLSRGEIETLRVGDPLTLSDPREQAVYDMARMLGERSDLDDRLYRRGVDQIGHRGIVELIWLIGLHRSNELQMRVHRLGAPVDVGFSPSNLVPASSERTPSGN